MKSFRQEMLQAASSAPSLLPDGPTAAAEYFLGHQNPDGGFADRLGQSDLYYTVFGLSGLLALGRRPSAPVRPFLEGLGGGDRLDLVNLGCLGRCWGSLGEPLPPALAAELGERVRAFRSDDGGYALSPHQVSGSPYACFVAMGALQDVALPADDPEAILACLRSCRSADGGYANNPGAEVGLTPLTASAVAVQVALGQSPEPSVLQWLRQRCQAGGFSAVPGLDMPDLLSTAVGLHALRHAGRPIDDLRESCRRFVLGLYDAGGGFAAHPDDDATDCEYTFYGLLALGCLA